MKVLLILFILAAQPLWASHLLGGYLSYRWVQGNQYEITVWLLTDRHSGVESGTGTLNFGDDTSQQGGFERDVEQKNENLNIVSFSILHSYPSSGSYEISYTEPNYNFGIVNIVNSGIVPFSIAATLKTSAEARINHSPVLMLINNQKGISGERQRINPAAFDADEDSLSYHFIVPRLSSDRKIPGYSYPNDPLFYTNFSTGNETHDGPPLYEISPATGDLLWDAPGLAGEYAVAFKITQWRKINNRWMNVGDNEVVLIDAITDALPDASIVSPASHCYPSPPNEQFVVTGQGEVNVFSDLAGSIINGFTVDPLRVLTFTVNGTLTLDFSTPPNLDVNMFRPYRVIITIETTSQTVTSTWAFAIGCDQLPDPIPPDPIPPSIACPELVIYPNPTAGEIITICVPDGMAENQHIRILDISGRILFSKHILTTSSPLQFDVSDFTPGLYVVQIDRIVKKFVVLR